MRTRAALLAGVALLPCACASRTTRPPSTETVNGQGQGRERPQPLETVRAEELYRPRDAKPGMFITWTIEESGTYASDFVEDSLACVGEVDGVLTTERRETKKDGSRHVTAVRYRRDGTIVGAWRGLEGGVGVPLRVVDQPTDWQAENAK